MSMLLYFPVVIWLHVFFAQINLSFLNMSMVITVLGIILLNIVMNNTLTLGGILLCVLDHPRLSPQSSVPNAEQEMPDI